MATAVTLDSDLSEPEKAKLRVEAWKTTVTVQMHFNDLELRIRNFAITVLTAVLAAVGLGIEKQLFIRIGGFTTNLAVWFLGIGVVAWLAFWFMDGFWYHTLLKAAGTHAGEIEDRLRTSDLGAFGLSTRISTESSKIVSSSAKMAMFYGVIAVLLVFAMVVIHRSIQPPGALPPG